MENLIQFYTHKHCLGGSPEVEKKKNQEPSQNVENTTSPGCVRPTFVVNEERVWRQGVLVVGDILQDVCEVHVHPDHAQQQVTKVTRPADGHDKPWRKEEGG